MQIFGGYGRGNTSRSSGSITGPNKVPPGVTCSIRKGEPVVVYDEGQPRGLWRLGRVTEVIPSQDGNIRAARVKVMSKSGRPTILKRPIQQLYPLEVRGTLDNDDTRELPEDTEVDGVYDGVRRDALPETEQSR